MYYIEFSKTAEKELLKLKKTAQSRIISTLDRIKIRPYFHVQKLVGSKYFRLRVGDYRVILKIDKGKLIVLVIKIGHRRNIYK